MKETKLVCDRCGIDVDEEKFRYSIIFNGKQRDLCKSCNDDLVDFMKWEKNDLW